jgi:hypothetical protein
MEALQTAAYGVVDERGTPDNQAIRLLSCLHIGFSPLFVNAFRMKLIPEQVKLRIWRSFLAPAV